MDPPAGENSLEQQPITQVEEEQQKDEEYNNQIQEKLKIESKGVSKQGVLRVKTSEESLRSSGGHSTTSSDSHKSNVSFSTVRVHKHNVTLGDNPSVTRGPPVSLDWAVEESETLQLEDYEGQNPRHLLMKLSSVEREAMVLAHGHSRESITRVSQEVEAIKQAREANAPGGGRRARSQSPRNLRSKPSGTQKSENKKNTIFGLFSRK